MHLKSISRATNGCTDMKEKIRQHFKNNDLPSVGVINYIGKWARGDCYAVTCGLFRLKRYCVYCIDGEIHSVRHRG